MIKEIFYYNDPSNVTIKKKDSEEEDEPLEPLEPLEPFEFKDDNDKIQLFCDECTKKLQKCNVWDKYWRGTDHWFGCSGVFVVEGDIKKCECGQSMHSCDIHRGFCEYCNVEKCTNSLFKMQ